MYVGDAPLETLRLQPDFKGDGGISGGMKHCILLVLKIELFKAIVHNWTSDVSI